MTGKGKPEKRREETDERERADLSLSLGFGFYHVERSESQLQRETTERRERRKSGRRPIAIAHTDILLPSVLGFGGFGFVSGVFGVCIVQHDRRFEIEAEGLV